MHLLVSQTRHRLAELEVRGVARSRVEERGRKGRESREAETTLQTKNTTVTSFR